MRKRIFGSILRLGERRELCHSIESFIGRPVRDDSWFSVPMSPNFITTERGAGPQSAFSVLQTRLAKIYFLMWLVVLLVGFILLVGWEIG